MSSNEYHKKRRRSKEIEEYLVDNAAIDRDEAGANTGLDASSTDATNARRNPRIKPELS